MFASYFAAPGNLRFQFAADCVERFPVRDVPRHDLKNVTHEPPAKFPHDFPFAEVATFAGNLQFEQSDLRP